MNKTEILVHAANARIEIAKTNREGMLAFNQERLSNGSAIGYSERDFASVSIEIEAEAALIQSLADAMSKKESLF